MGCVYVSDKLSMAKIESWIKFNGQDQVFSFKIKESINLCFPFH